MSLNRPFDKYEKSPNSSAKCRSCRKKILRGENRFGVQVFFHKWRKWGSTYYHKDCLSKEEQAGLNLQSSSGQRNKLGSSTPVTPDLVEARLSHELQRQEARESSRRQLVYQARGDLREKLRQLRLGFARKLEYDKVYFVFNNKTLDDIVAKMPKDLRELQKCIGMGPKRCKQYGVPILQTIKLYKHASQEEPAAGADDGIIAGPVLSVEEIVNQRMEEARQRGEELVIL
mmetsp:Transcript_19342/g.41765  ORF Transcript_19342/g.41765 Transcript_19342/m.41765 type:complete len:230 (+) Transcript_19342:92-781(+)